MRTLADMHVDDIRPRLEFEVIHIETAVRIPMAELEKNLPLFLFSENRAPYPVIDVSELSIPR